MKIIENKMPDRVYDISIDCSNHNFFFSQIKCYHKSDVTSEREVIFRLQFHTGAVQGYNLMFEKEDMETANKGIKKTTTLRAGLNVLPLVFTTPPAAPRSICRAQSGLNLDCWHFETNNLVFPNMLRVAY